MTTRSRPKSRRFQNAIRLVALMGLAAASGPAPAGNMSFLQDAPSSYFRGDDGDLMMKNARAVLDSSDPNAKQSWSNPKTGASGFAQVVGKFTGADGAPCKRLRIGNQAGGLQGEGTYTLCKYQGRGWIFHSDAQPAS